MPIRKARSEKELTKAVAELLTKTGHKFWRVDNYACPKCRARLNPRAADMPDFFVYWPCDPPFSVECKVGGRKLTSGQQKVCERLREAGIPYVLVRDTVDSLLAFLKVRRA